MDRKWTVSRLNAVNNDWVNNLSDNLPSSSFTCDLVGMKNMHIQNERNKWKILHFMKHIQKEDDSRRPQARIRKERNKIATQRLWNIFLKGKKLDFGLAALCLSEPCGYAE